MTLLSFGDKLEQGTYAVHSRFSKVTNFISGSSFIFVVNNSIGGGPFNIVVDGEMSLAWQSLEVKDGHCTISGEQFALIPEKQYTSILAKQEFDKTRFLRNLESFENILIKNASAKSLAFLLDRSRRKFFTSSFEKGFVDTFESAASAFEAGDLVTGAGMIKGLGFGLTPSGDDFNCGFLIALDFLQTQNIADNEAVKTGVYEAALGTNLFTNVFLGAAKNGFLFEKFRNVILSLIHSGQNEIAETTGALLAHGETSGADESVGFLSGLKRYLK